MKHIFPKRLGKIWFNFLTSGLSFQNEHFLYSKVMVFNSFSVVGITSAITFGLIHGFSGTYSIGILEVICGLIALINLIMLRRTGNVNTANSIQLMIMILLLSMLLRTGGMQNTGIYWYYTYPPLAFFLKGKREGFFWIFSLYLVSIAILLLHKLRYIQDFPYSFVQVRQMLISLFAVSLLVFFYEKVREQNEKLIHAQNLELVKRNEQLVQEIEVRKQVQEALSKSERWLAATLKSIGEAVIASDIEGKIMFMNPIAEMLTRWQQEEALGKDVVFNGLSEETFPSTEPSAPESLQDGIVINITHDPLLIARDGKEVPIEYKGTPIKDEKGSISGIVLIFQDISERRRTEAALREAKEAAEAANRAKSIFLAKMGHELRTPLNAILGYAHILKDSDNLTERQKRGLKTVERSGEHLLTIINDILDISTIETGQLKLQMSEFVLPKFLKHIADMIQLYARQKGLAFVYEYEPDPNLSGYIRADEKRLRQVLMSLLGNAVKFTKKGSVTFRVRVRSNRFSNLSISTAKAVTTNLYFEIEDTGIGIATEELKEIFFPFQQIDGQYHSVEGTGLGLTISRQLVEIMGGELHVESTVGKGSVFWFELIVPEILKDSSQKEILATTQGSCQPPYEALGADNRVEIETPCLVPLPLETTNRLLEFAVRGNPKKLIAELDNLGPIDEKYTPFVNKLRQLAQNYQVDQCIELLKAEKERN